MTAKIFSAGTLQHKTSRSISSLGGSYIESYGGNMTFMQKTVISATIGGTAEALGGGKPACVAAAAGRFANGAVTGAYVMMLNHLHNEKARNELQAKLNLAIKQQHNYSQRWR